MHVSPQLAVTEGEASDSWLILNISGLMPLGFELAVILLSILSCYDQGYTRIHFTLPCRTEQAWLD